MKHMRKRVFRVGPLAIVAKDGTMVVWEVRKTYRSNITDLVFSTDRQLVITADGFNMGDVPFTQNNLKRAMNFLAK